MIPVFVNLSPSHLEKAMSTITKHIVLVLIAFAVGAVIATKWPGKIPFVGMVAGQ